MIAELSASLASIKSAIDLVKVINEAKTESDIRNATYELQRQLMSLQIENIRLAELISSQVEQIRSLRTELSEESEFKHEVEQYLPTKLDSGTIVYSCEINVNGEAITQYVCPNCFKQKKISILQPLYVSWREYHCKSSCPLCKSEFRMNKNPNYKQTSSFRVIKTHR